MALRLDPDCPSGGKGLGRHCCWQRLCDDGSGLAQFAQDLDQADLHDLRAAQAGAVRTHGQLFFKVPIDLGRDAAFLRCFGCAHVGNVGFANMKSNIKLLAIYVFARNVGIMSTTKGRNLGLRFDEQDTKDLDLFERSTGIEATTLARNATRACLAYWKKHGKISFPLRLIEAASSEKKEGGDSGSSETPPPPESAPPSQARRMPVSKSRFEVKQIISPEAPQPSESEKNSSRLNEGHGPSAQRFKEQWARRDETQHKK